MQNTVNRLIYKMIDIFLILTAYVILQLFIEMNSFLQQLNALYSVLIIDVIQKC